MLFVIATFLDIWSQRQANMHEHFAPVSNSADTGSVLYTLMMNAASFPFIACTLDTIWLVAPKLSSHCITNKPSSSSESKSELRPGYIKSIISS